MASGQSTAGYNNLDLLWRDDDGLNMEIEAFMKQTGRQDTAFYARLCVLLDWAYLRAYDRATGRTEE